MKSRTTILATLVVMTWAPTLGLANQILDTFDRPNANTLGNNWTVQNGGAQIVDDQAEGIDGIEQSDLLTFNNYSTNSLSVDVADNGGSLEYVALDLGYADLNDNYFIKVQDQGGNGMFNYYAFYYGNNGVTGCAGCDLFQTLATPFSAGTITATLTGTTVTLDVAPTNGSLQTYSFDYGIATGGSGVGLGFYGTALADNFAGALAPEPSSVALFGVGGALFFVGRLRRRVVPVRIVRLLRLR